MCLCQCDSRDIVATYKKTNCGSVWDDLDDVCANFLVFSFLSAPARLAQGSGVDEVNQVERSVIKILACFFL